MKSLQNNILLVEDDPNDVLLLQRAFRKAGVTRLISVVGDGEEAIAYLSGQSRYADREMYPLPVLVLLDLKLPRKTGHEVLAWLRSQPSFMKRLPVIVLTSSRQTADINRAYEIGANSYLVKPSEFEELLKLIRTMDFYWNNLNEKPDLRPPA